MTAKKDGNSVKIIGVSLNSASASQVLTKIIKQIEVRRKTFLVTLNPEFLVNACKNQRFKKILNSATMAIPDGVGLIWASRFLGTQPRLKKRITGADLAAILLKKANLKHWRVGVIGARRGVEREVRVFIKNLQEKYPQAKIFSLEETKGWQKKEWEMIFACQGMGDQEKWIQSHFTKTNAYFFMGTGGALDFLTGFAQRAPKWVRQAGLEWLYRLFKQPWRWQRQLALIQFVWLVIREKLKKS